MRRLALVTALCVSSSAPAAAQRGVEWQVHAVSVVTGSKFAGGGVGVAWRSAGRLQFGAAVSGGVVDDRAALRGEAALSYHVNPFKRRGVAPYVAGGLAVTATDAVSREFVMLVLGLESRPGGDAGFFLEAGVAGGMRVAGGLRLRRRQRR